MPGPKSKPASLDPYSRAFLTLITRSSYLPGLVVLIDSLYKHGSQHPLIVHYTDSLPEDTVQTLKQLRHLYPLCRPLQVDSIAVPNGSKPIAERFADTLTKLRVFQPIHRAQLASLDFDKAPEQICFLDADILIRRNLDDIFDIPRPGPDWIAAHPACSCNADGDPAQPDHWIPENCPCTPLLHPEALNAPSIAPKNDAQRDTYSMMNSGVFVCTLSQELWERMEHFRLTDPRIPTFKYPDQNFLDAFFENRWVPIGWQYNAMKTIRYWHTNIWRDEEVRCLHYVVDKPWEQRTGKGEDAGYLGKDGETHYWWWQAFDEWMVRAQGSDTGVQVAASVMRCLVPTDPAQNRVGGKELLARLGKSKRKHEDRASNENTDAADDDAAGLTKVPAMTREDSGVEMEDVQAE